MYECQTNQILGGGGVVNGMKSLKNKHAGLDLFKDYLTCI